ncbi:MAG: pentapeptide repeat-containing protein [Acidobacteria bacterium]|nr:pentapeptide repeat-containing protein [Acidobacteriota bacterium]MBV9477911.1 pentapeptide repeat-containing protein [Acidobacteriota bacterium]
MFSAGSAANDEDGLTAVLRAHAEWLATDGRQGSRANLGGADLRNAPLAMADLRRANLRRADLRGASLSDASLQEADLQGADLSDVTGLCDHQLAGANLSGAQLPKKVAGFDGLWQASRLSKKASATFTFLSLAVLYCWVTIATTTDARLLTNYVSSPLPVIQTPIPLFLFYIVAPFVLAALYLYLHLQLQDLWEEIATLPAVFPDGRSLRKKVHPWLLTSLLQRRPGDAHHSVGGSVQTFISWILAWGLAPATLILFWLRYLPRHDWIGSLLHVGLLGFAVFIGAWSHQSTFDSLRFKKPRFLAKSTAIALTTTVAAAIVSFGAIAGIDQHAEDHSQATAPPLAPVAGRWLRTHVPALLSRLQLRAFADMQDTAVSERPPNWSFLPSPKLLSRTGDRTSLRDTPSDDVVRSVVGASLRGKDLKYANARGAFLVAADLTDSNWRGADLSFTYMQQADLENSNLPAAYLANAQLQNALMKAAHLEGSYLGEARLEGADLRSASMEGAILVGAKLNRADLSFAQLARTLFSDADLTDAELFGAQLRSANLASARGLTQAQIDEAFTDCTTRLPANLINKRCNTPAASLAILAPRCAVAGGPAPELRGGSYTVTLKSDANTCAAVIGGTPDNVTLAKLDQPPAGFTAFERVAVGPFYTFTPIPSGAPAGTRVVNLPPGDGRSGYFKVTFVAPKQFSRVELRGRANVDDIGRVFLNGRPLTGSIFSHTAVSEFGDVAFAAGRETTALLKPGAVNELIVSDMNTGAGPSGAAFYARITFRK